MYPHILSVLKKLEFYLVKVPAYIKLAVIEKEFTTRQDLNRYILIHTIYNIVMSLIYRLGASREKKTLRIMKKALFFIN